MDAPVPSVCIVGTGAIGSWLAAALLSAAKSEVVLIARGDHGRAIKEKGLTARVHNDSESVRTAEFAPSAFKAYATVAEAMAQGCPPVDYAILAVKTHQIPEAASQVLPLLTDRGCVVTTQNGLEAPHQAACAVGPARVLGGTAKCNCWVGDPGVVEILGGAIPNNFTFGEAFDDAGAEVTKSSSKHSARSEALTKLFAGSDTEACVAEDGCWTALWAKAGFTSCVGPVTALCRTTVPGLLCTPETRRLLRSAMLEWAACREAAGHLPGETVEGVTERLLKWIEDDCPPSMTTSITRDVLMGKPSELQDLSGSIQRAGIRLGIATPTHDFILAALMPQELRARGEFDYMLNGVPGGAPHVMTGATEPHATKRPSEQGATNEALQLQLDSMREAANLGDSGGCRVALTMHDLPEWPHWRCKAGQPAVTITNKILSALEKHALTGVYNFANSGTGLLADDSSTVLPYDETHKDCFEAWVAAGHHIANHTHSHAAVYEITTEDLKGDILRADKELSCYLCKAPTKLFCFCTDCQGDTTQVATELAEYVTSLGYQQLPAASMVYEWRWEMAYLGALSTGDDATAAKLRLDFIEFSVRQTVLDIRRGRLLCGDGFIPSLLLHMLNIVADTLDEWLAALQAAGCTFAPAEEALLQPYLKRLEGVADPEHKARPALAKIAEAEGLKWEESSIIDTEIMKRVRELGDKAMEEGHVILTKHLGDRDISGSGSDGPNFSGALAEQSSL